LATASDVGTAVGVAAAPDAAGGIVPPNCIVVVRAGAGGTTVSAITPSGLAAVPAGLDLPDRTLVLAANAFGHIGPFPPEFFARPTGSDQGQVYLDFSSVVGVIAFAVQLTR
jgi:hypothetical protein